MDTYYTYSFKFWYEIRLLSFDVWLKKYQDGVYIDTNRYIQSNAFITRSDLS